MKDTEKPNAKLIEEIRYIDENAGQGILYVQGLFRLIKEDGLSLDQAHKTAVEVPNNAEHIPAWDQARDFLQEHAQQLGIDETNPVDKL
jgi:hypothetical protein